MYYPCRKQMTRFVLIITDQYLCYVVYQSFFEKVMYNRLLNFLEEHKFFVNEQFGFRKSHSSYMALMTLMDKLIKSLEKGEYMMGIFLDFFKSLWEGWSWNTIK